MLSNDFGLETVVHPLLAPENDDKFNEILLVIDRRLASAHVAIPWRPTTALGEVSKQFSLPLPVTEPRNGSKHESAELWPISARIFDWYEKRYGDRLKLDFSPGRMVVLVEEDLWVLRLPRIYGSAEIVVSREIQPRQSDPKGRPLRFNVVEALEEMPQHRVAALQDAELAHIHEKFILGMQAFSVLEGTASQHELIRSALADVAAAVEHLMATPPQFGLSKWSSLQASEKALKAAIELAGGAYSSTHVLSTLTKQAVASGIINRWNDLIPHIQCSPGIRYGDEKCDRDDAVRAHYASLAIMVLLQECGARFESSMDVQR